MRLNAFLRSGIILFACLTGFLQAAVSPHPNLMWERKSDFENHAIEIAGDAAFERIIDRDRIENVARYVPDRGLDPGEYYWKAISDKGIIQSGQFRIDSPDRSIVIPQGSAMQAIREALAFARECKSCIIQFEPGTYHFSPGHLDVVFDVENTSDLIIDGQGSKFVIHDIAGVAKVGFSQHITMRNFTVDYDASIYTAAMVESVSPDGTILLSLLDGCAPPESVERFMDEKKGLFIDPAFPKPAEDIGILVEMKDAWEPLGEGKYRLQAKRPKELQNLQPGMAYVCAPRHGVQGFQFNHSEDITLVDVTTYYLPGIGVATHFVNDLKLIRYNMLRRDDRLLGLQNGGTNIHGARIGPWVEDCRYENPGDDCNHISSTVLAANGQPEPDVVTFAPQQVGAGLSSPDLDIRKGDKLAFFDRKNGQLISEATVVEKKLQQNRETWVRLDQDIPQLHLRKTGKGISKTELEWTQVYDLSRSCGNFVFRGNTFIRGRRIGILAKSGPGLIENNRFIELGAGGVDFWNAPLEGLYAHDVLVQDNHFEGGGRVSRKAGYASAIWSEIFAGKPSHPLHRNIRILNNTIIDYPANGMLLVDVTGLIIRGNKILRSGSIPVKQPLAEPIRVENVVGATIENNDSNY